MPITIPSATENNSTYDFFLLLWYSFINHKLSYTSFLIFSFFWWCTLAFGVSWGVVREEQPSIEFHFGPRLFGNCRIVLPLWHTHTIIIITIAIDICVPITLHQNHIVAFCTTGHCPNCCTKFRKVSQDIYYCILCIHTISNMEWNILTVNSTVCGVLYLYWLLQRKCVSLRNKWS